MKLRFVYLLEDMNVDEFQLKKNEVGIIAKEELNYY